MRERYQAWRSRRRYGYGWHVGVQWPPRVGFEMLYYDAPWYVVHLGLVWVSYHGWFFGDYTLDKMDKTDKTDKKDGHE